MVNFIECFNGWDLFLKRDKNGIVMYGSSNKSELLLSVKIRYTVFEGSLCI